jgi:hypothetical protein
MIMRRKQHILPNDELTSVERTLGIMALSNTAATDTMAWSFILFLVTDIAAVDR